MSSLTADTYRQYKEHTESMLKWLSNSLRGLDIAFDGRLEDASIRKLLELASCAKDAGAVMPYQVIHSLEQALKLRRKYNAWFSKNFSRQASSEDIKRIQHSNEAHAAYNDVLQCIHDLFAPAKTQASHSLQSSSSSLDKKILEVNNLFARLEVEETAEKEQQSSTTRLPSASASASTPAAKSLVQKKARMLIEDKILELYCLYDDANKIRDYLRNKWAEYSSRKIDLESVSLTTQVALESFAEVEKAFELKHSAPLKDHPDVFWAKYGDIYAYLATGELFDSVYYDDSAAYQKKQDKTAARAQTRQRQEFQLRIGGPKLQLPDELRNWVFNPMHLAIDKMMSKDDYWILKQACRSAADRSGDLDAVMGLSGGQATRTAHSLCAAAREYLDTCIEFYAGIMFIAQTDTAFLGPADFITNLWHSDPWDNSIRMVLCVQFLHDIRTAKPEPGQVQLLTQISEDYKKLGDNWPKFNKEERAETLTPEEYEVFQRRMEKHRFWMDGQVPALGDMGLLKKMKKKRLQKLQRLPLLVNPLLGGIFLFFQSVNYYRNTITVLNTQWCLVPCAHLINWVTVATKNTTADFQKIWTDFGTALELIGPRPIWMGSGPPETLSQCRNRMLLACGLPLTEFYKRMKDGDIPRAEELFKRIKNNKTQSAKRSEEYRKQVDAIGAAAYIASRSGTRREEEQPQKRPGDLLEIAHSQHLPLLNAARENLCNHDKVKAQQPQIRKVVLARAAAAAADGPEEKKVAKSSARVPWDHQEQDMISYIESFSRAAQYEMPRLRFPYAELTSVCRHLLTSVFITVQKWGVLPTEMRLEEEAINKGEFGRGSQNVCCLLALYMMFRDKQPVLDEALLDLVEEGWEMDRYETSRDVLTRDFVQLCKDLGFTVPECALAASPSGEASGEPSVNSTG
ncbi:hypothetical protein Daus18300_003073 [Diaporthe australafricana]|uniref:DUF6604 domain-containing protein n=1 Tax=Diaporthe australafricana TaxID=127596 RepID=A0ABR3XIU7_9PEZI